MKAKLGIAPIAWWNDDLPEISSDIPLEGCLAKAREAGFTGMETGRTEEELDLLTRHSREGLPLLFDAGHKELLRVMAAAGYEVVH